MMGKEDKPGSFFKEPGNFSGANFLLNLEGVNDIIHDDFHDDYC